MSSVESTKAGFFPNVSTKNQTKKAAEANKTTALKKNDPARKAELDALSQSDAKVSINDGVKEFAKIKKIADATPAPDNSDKIASLKKQIAEGTYQVNYDALADKMLSTEF